MIKCPKCGEENRDNDRFCLNCGNSLEKQVEQKKKIKEYQKLQEAEKQKLPKKEKTDDNKTYRDYNRRYTRKTSKNIKTINQGKITRERFTTRIKNKFKELLQKEIQPVPLILSMLFPGLGFTYYNKWMRAIFILIVTVIFILYVLPLEFGRVYYGAYWVLILILTHNES